VYTTDERSKSSTNNSCFLQTLFAAGKAIRKEKFIILYFGDQFTYTHSNPQKGVARKAVCNKTQRNTKNEMAR
jgi:hypothetical protein